MLLPSDTVSLIISRNNTDSHLHHVTINQDEGEMICVSRCSESVTYDPKLHIKYIINYFMVKILTD